MDAATPWYAALHGEGRTPRRCDQLALFLVALGFAWLAIWGSGQSFARLVWAALALVNAWRAGSVWINERRRTRANV